MESKSYTFILIGILIGGGLGYVGTSYILSQDIDELTSEKLRSTADNTQLSLAYNSLKKEHDTLSDNYDSLSDDYDSISENYDQLLSQIDDLESSYEELFNQYQLAIASLPLSSDPISGDTINMTYTWTFEGREWTLSLSIPESIYNYYKDKERASTRDYSIYVTHPYDDEFINTIIMRFNHIALKWGFSEEKKINLVISFVQSLPYTSDLVTTSYDNYPRYPLETLVDNGGDCEDTSILTASLLKVMNYDVVLLDLPRHLAVGINLDTYGTYYSFNDKKYFYLETTGEGWGIGEIPEDFEDTSLEDLYELKPIPICTFNWTAAWKGSMLEIVFTANNEGTAIASNIMVYIAFDDGEEEVWNPVESDPFNLNAGRSYTLTLLLDPPRDKHTRLVLGIVDVEAYQYIERRYSTWFDT
jgi:hypothetical protein